jgi:hypothetical protein
MVEGYFGISKENTYFPPIFHYQDFKKTFVFCSQDFQKKFFGAKQIPKFFTAQLYKHSAFAHNSKTLCCAAEQIQLI